MNLEELVTKVQGAAKALVRIRNGVAADLVLLNLEQTRLRWAVSVREIVGNVPREIGVAHGDTVIEALQTLLAKLVTDLGERVASAKAVIAEADQIVKDERP